MSVKLDGGVGAKDAAVLAKVKCFEAGFDQVVMLSSDNKRIRELRKHVKERVPKDAQEKVWLFLPSNFIAFLDEQAADEVSTEQKVRGYKVKVRYQALDPKGRDAKPQAIARSFSNQ